MNDGAIYIIRQVHIILGQSKSSRDRVVQHVKGRKEGRKKGRRNASKYEVASPGYKPSHFVPGCSPSKLEVPEDCVVIYE